MLYITWNFRFYALQDRLLRWHSLPLSIPLWGDFNSIKHDDTEQT